MDQNDEEFDMRFPAAMHHRNDFSPYPLQTPESMREQLAVAKSTISFLALESQKVEASYAALQGEYNALDNLLAESGRTLQRLQTMYHEEKDTNAALTLSLTQANERIALLERAGDPSTMVTAPSSSSAAASTTSTASTSKAIRTRPIDDDDDDNNENSINGSLVLTTGHNRHKSHHIDMKNSLRDMAERLCDELCRVDDHISLLEPMIQRQREEEQAAQTAAGAPMMVSPRRSLSPERDEVDFLFGSPSARLSVHQSVKEEDEDGEDEG